MTALTFFADFGTANFTLNSTNLSSMLQQFFVDNSHLIILNLNSSIQVEEYEGKCYPLVRKSPLSTCFLNSYIFGMNFDNICRTIIKIVVAKYDNHYHQ